MGDARGNGMLLKLNGVVLHIIRYSGTLIPSRSGVGDGGTTSIVVNNVHSNETRD